MVRVVFGDSASSAKSKESSALVSLGVVGEGGEAGAGKPDRERMGVRGRGLGLPAGSEPSERRDDCAEDCRGAYMLGRNAAGLAVLLGWCSKDARVGFVADILGDGGRMVSCDDEAEGTLSGDERTTFLRCFAREVSPGGGDFGDGGCLDFG